MTYAQKQRIEAMRSGGESYAVIADSLGISINTVKSYYRRNKLAVAATTTNGTCPECGAMLVHTKGSKRKRFCSDRCRMAWWNSHPEAVRHSSVSVVTCEHCGCEFEAYGNRKRKFCSQECYRAARARR